MYLFYGLWHQKKKKKWQEKVTKDFIELGAQKDAIDLEIQIDKKN
jgi:hypothetical protein